MEKNQDKFEKFIKFYLLVSSLLLFGGFVFLNSRLDSFSRTLGSLAPVSSATPQLSDECGEKCKEEISKAVSQALAGIPTSKPAATVAPKTATAVNGTVKTTYIPLAGPITTTSTGWVDTVGTDVYIDLAGDYSKNAKVSWDAFLSVTNGNGTAYGRLFDVTHGIAVNGSEISTSNGSLTQVSSGNSSLWSGRNLYRVQLKSLNSFVVTFGSGRIKISY